MNLIKYVTKNFDYIWNEYCSEGIGYRILDQKEFSSDQVFPFMWGYNKKLGVRIFILLVTIQDKLIPFVFIVIGKKGIPIRIKSKHTNIGDFHFSKQELKINNLQLTLEEKCKHVNEKSFQTILAAISRPKSSKRSKEEPRSVRTISGGLYGLGKNRKH